MELLRLFADHLLPIFLTAGAGYALSAALRPDPRPMTHAAFYVLAPALVFQVLVDSAFAPGALARMGAFTLAALLVPAAVALAIARAAGWPRPLASAVVLVTLLPNAGNFGMSANLLAFGPEGLAQASLFFVVSAVVSYTLGVFVASLGRASLADSLGGLLRVPTLWAVALAFAMLASGARLPRPADQAVDLLAQACVPVFLVILGMQLRETRVRGPVRPLLLASALRLGGGAAAGLMLAPLFGLEGAARHAAVFQAAMPSAVISTILATEYDVEPGLVTSVVFLTTLLSPLTLTPLLAWLR
jgi:hypothetical protein